MTKETKEFLLRELDGIKKWEKEQLKIWFWEHLSKLPFKLLDKITPEFIQNKIGKLLDEVGNFIQTGGQYLVKEDTVIKKINKRSNIEVLFAEEVSYLPLETMDKVSNDIKSNNTNIATVQGATTGFGGLFTLVIDIPMILGLSLKTLQEIAITYGYNPKNKRERIFIIKCLQFASADVVGKEAILKELSNFDNKDNESQDMLSQLKGWREVISTYRDQFGLKKLLQMIPVAGMIFGIFSNRSMLSDVAETGIMLYRKRRILNRLNGPNIQEYEELIKE